MEALRLRNLTTGKLHTQIEHVYEDMAFIVSYKGIMTHQIPAALKAIKPYLKRVVLDSEYWDGEFRPDVQGEYEISPMCAEEKSKFFEIFLEESDKFWERRMASPKP